MQHIHQQKHAANYSVQDFSKPPFPTDKPVGQMNESLLQTAPHLPQTEVAFFHENKRILIVEDNNNLRILIADFLSSYYDVAEASNGMEAARLLQEKETDLIISDIKTPLKDGICLCTEVKNNTDTSHIPFIMVMAKAGHERQLEVLEAGADACLEKPIHFEILHRLIDNIFKQQERYRFFYSRNFFPDTGETPANRQYNAFLKKLYDLLDANLDNSELSAGYIASEMSMSQRKLYSKLKATTGKSIVEIILNYRLRKAARLLMEEDLSVGEIMMRVGIESQSYFTRVFRKEFNEPPAAFAAKYKKH